MNTTLKDAIESLALHAHSTHRLRDWSDELALVLAAARTVSCERCGGTGRIRRPIINWSVSTDDDGTIDCGDCKANRSIAREGINVS